MNKLSKAMGLLRSNYGLVAASLAGGGVVAAFMLASSAGATNYDPTSNLTTLASSAGNTMGPIVIAVVTAVIGIAVLFWGVRFILHFVSRGRARV